MRERERENRSIRKSLFQLLVRLSFMLRIYKWPETNSDANTFTNAIVCSRPHQLVGTRSWSRYVQMCASYLTIQRTTLVGAFEIRFRTLVYEQLETRETLTLTLIPNP